MRSRYLGVTAAFAALLWAAAGLPSQASPWAEVGDNQLRADVELLQAAGVFHDITIQWPLPWRTLLIDLSHVDAARQPAPLRAAIARVLARAQSATAQGLSASASLDATNRPAVVYGFDGMGRGEGQAQLSLEGTSGIFSGRIALGAITQNYRGNRTKLMPDGSYAAVTLGDVSVYAGYLDHWWGSGQISALSLSNNARPMPQVGIARAQTTASSWPVLRWLGPWQAEFFLGYLDGPRLQTDSYYSAARFVMQPLKGFEVAIARTEEFCGQGHPCVPLRDYFHFSNNPTSVNSTSDQLSWDFKYSDTLAGVPYQAYLQLMNEDYPWFVHSGTSHLFGFSVFVPTAENPVKLTAEFTDSISTRHPFSFGDHIYGFSYTNGTFIDGMRYRGRTLGFSLDDDSTLMSVQGSWSDAAGRFFELSFHHATIGSYHSAGANIVSPIPVLLNMGEARVTLPWQSLKLDIDGRVQDDQPRPHKGFAAAVEVALRAPL